MSCTAGAADALLAGLRRSPPTVAGLGMEAAGVPGARGRLLPATVTGLANDRIGCFGSMVAAVGVQGTELLLLSAAAVSLAEDML
eukprot:CAMPEP_0178386770 /NCGR_PEP_ID=MMETSP0689_2-20121128/8732_1 /TAXON_ID=160604 /ORGANISM="Amphidinium massartii, Strain CS-259" /LENGTH=84 /DNA_ID=CAMNT_0020007119 /DNA_START=473 /DNA_END=723 /DNA_ORIENTATION=+